MHACKLLIFLQYFCIFEGDYFGTICTELRFALANFFFSYFFLGWLSIFFVMAVSELFGPSQDLQSQNFFFLHYFLGGFLCTKCKL
jgi:hypothetical protein